MQGTFVANKENDVHYVDLADGVYLRQKIHAPNGAGALQPLRAFIGSHDHRYLGVVVQNCHVIGIMVLGTATELHSDSELMDMTPEDLPDVIKAGANPSSYAGIKVVADEALPVVAASKSPDPVSSKPASPGRWPKKG